MQHFVTTPDMPSDVDRSLEAKEKPQEEEQPEAEGEKTDDDDEREPMYDNTDYDHVRFDPIWYGDYPGDEMPLEIAEYLGENLEYAHVHQMVGSSRTIFHMCGRPDVVRMIDDPAYVIDDEIVAVPIGCFPVSFLLSRYQDEGIFPWDHVPGLESGAVKKCSIPASVTETVAAQELKALYPFSRPVTSGETIKVVRVQHNRNFNKFEKDVTARFADGLLQRKDTLFRGLTLLALEKCLAFFLPVIRSTNADNEFGPGIYTTGDLATAKDYAGRAGAIMVFSTPDERPLNCWEPTGDEWRRLTARWLGLSLSDTDLSPAYYEADVIKGAMSADQSKGQRQNRFLTPGNIKQQAFVSYRGCESLRRELKAIIFIESSK
ncbi:hypothetical protein AO1008_03601 [Aspergillus oryzae 100-8]|uniref:Uncharacterized protein n=1 Tax=Aspergillus oryzae (strain 3.042) TaxID=1160506 RepID=I7ZKU0_ASPO3|nr:hypothetical protein Ao3042_01158 [Aspergillus oryzae 3.042]KDE77555.1 hypothetical protein AO1008_03601 [Aspergillus oryzae 100-8]|eukprot:EIT72559.1 hypothetical protein Ao3042_01158 [Aspergillus oryzae 3.042]